MEKLNMAGITEPGSSIKNKTGNWRYLFPFIDGSKCTGCGICELFCPDSSITIDNNKASINEFYCKGCGICAKECSTDAIIMQEEG